MGRLVDEVEQWNTPVLGAFLLWKFSLGYFSEHPTSEAPSAILHFLVAPILTNSRLSEPISNRRDGLQSYIRSFETDKETDLLVGIQKKIEDKKQYTLTAIDIAVANGLLAWEYDTGKLYPRQLVGTPQRGNSLRKSVVRAGGKG